jgi:hypothetical protein
LVADAFDGHECLGIDIEVLAGGGNAGGGDGPERGDAIADEGDFFAPGSLGGMGGASGLAAGDQQAGEGE